MYKRKNIFSYMLYIELALLSSAFLFPCFQHSDCMQPEAILYNASPARVKQYYPDKAQYAGVSESSEYFPNVFNFKPNKIVYFKKPHITSEKVFQIEASDATDGIKYSQPAIGHHQLSSYHSGKVPSYILEQKIPQMPAQHPSPTYFQDQTFSSSKEREKISSKPMRDLRYLDSLPDTGYPLSETIVESEYKISDNNLDNILSNLSFSHESSVLYAQDKSNFTDSKDNLVSVSSDAVLSYEIPSSIFNDTISVVKQNIERAADDVPSLNNSDFNLSTVFPVLENELPGFVTQTSVVYNTQMDMDFINQTNITDVISTVIPSMHEDGNVSSTLPSSDNESNKLSSGTVAGIVIAVLVSVTVLSSAVIYLLYRKFNGKCTSAVESKFNSDNCGYLDDSLRSSIYLNTHIEMPKESSEEMTSLDNDSFLNSLETMTIQNYWADTTKNTKV